ncbi:hypothetical protein BpJC7_20520 [Weizmannia acidilactici]|uniref:SHSP domain-containing protein n=1 Tax=Weizmannia acidilactici TaxID=2607726 RepID=A0A5J4JHI1_9BACI|nr:Hsp20/alpha crystallin family protein [Weizmannia acidilactici]GER67885.1 hypothetical protein BpJC4_23560 [Weizmannia acidilactici]GER70749.1 hypothetical protein BpJC7_20520 [Weizmannia acidilactici]GER73728.1 hypothetical protein BpPP18_17950 [Weizmannia acidilactici]
MSNLSGPNEKNPFYELMHAMDHFFQEKPVKHFLQSIDEFFSSPFPFDAFPVRMEEEEDMYLITAKLPGYKKDQIEIDIFQQFITISVKHDETETSVDEEKQSYVKKSEVRRLSRTVSLPHPIDGEQVKAKYDNGLLTIRVPKGKKKRLLIE